MTESVNKTPPSAEQLHDYAEVRGLVALNNYPEALQKLRGAKLNGSTKEQLQKALETDDTYIIDRTFGELDARIMQALCWECWKE